MKREQPQDPMLPLRGIKVVDFGQGIAGPHAAMLMGDFGADVIKVEPPRGDWARTLGTRIGETESASFVSVNRNKRGIVLDLARPEGVEAALRLVADCDVLVQSFRPAVMARYQLDYDSLAGKHPKLVYCSVSGFGAQGPHVDLPAGDSTMQAMGGLMSIIGDAGGAPMRVGNVVTDMLAGMNAFQGALLALMNRGTSGRGCHVEVALIDSLVAFQAPAFAEFLATGMPPPRTGNNHPLMAPSGLFETADGALVFSVLAHQWRAFCDFFGVPQMAADPRFIDNPARLANREALMAQLRPLFKTQPRAFVLARLRACDVPCAPVNDFADVAADPQVQLNGLLASVDHPRLGKVPFVRNPVRLDGAATAAGHVPLLGEHSEIILVQAGYTQAQIDRLARDKVIHMPAAAQQH